jgi:hypothetical protein
MRAWITVLVAAAALTAGTSVALSGWRSEVPVYPPYPYKAGHYPTADSYYDLPPYAAINPGFYRWRYFLMAQERNRYRYVPHIFRGYTGYKIAAESPETPVIQLCYPCLTQARDRSAR